MKRIFLLVILVAALILNFTDLSGAQGKSEKKPSGPAQVKASGPDLWQYLQKSDFEKNWKMWPGKNALYPGKEPHGALLTTYVNDAAYKAVEGKKGKLPNGSIIVKENYTQDKKLEAYTVMYKSKGFNPKADDWFWASYDPDGKVKGAGKMEMCIQCHGKNKANDYIMTAPLK